MGQVYVNIEVGHEKGGEMVSIPDVLVDTGSAHTTLPTLLNNLHIEPVEPVDLRLPGGKIVTWDVGQARIRLAGSPSEWTCPVYFCPKDDEYLLGATTLEIFGLMVDPVEEGLVRKPVRARSI